MEDQSETGKPEQVGREVQPFRFYTSMVLQESTGLRAVTLPELVRVLRTVPLSSVYHHTHHFLLQHHYLTPAPSNDFAYWVTEVLGEEPLGELLSSVDTMEYSTLHSLRRALVSVVEDYLTRNPTARFKFSSQGEEFFFVKSVHLVMPTRHTALTLEEFAEGLRRVSIRSLYFHIFDARLRLGSPTNDFALWIGEQLRLKPLAADVARLDPYSHTLEALQSMVLSLIRRELEGHGKVTA